MQKVKVDGIGGFYYAYIFEELNNGYFLVVNENSEELVVHESMFIYV